MSEKNNLQEGEVMEKVWLLGLPRLWDYLDFVKDVAVGGANADTAACTAEWRTANTYYQQLERSEQGIADRVECFDLDPALEPLTEEVNANSSYQRSIKTLPTRFGMVELDKLVVSQRSVTRNYIDKVKSRLTPRPDLESIFRACLPLAHPDTQVKLLRMDSGRYVFQSDSSDFRFHESALLQTEQLDNYDALGPVSNVLGLFVGFSINFLCAIQWGSRLLLHNGYHRACALRELGITHAPCMIHTVTCLDELDLVANPVVTTNSEFYFIAPRPPLLKDYFDSQIRKVWPVRKVMKVIEMNFEVRDYLVPI